MELNETGSERGRKPFVLSSGYPSSALVSKQLLTSELQMNTAAGVFCIPNKLFLKLGTLLDRLLPWQQAL